ncbi:hypothetical protein HN873_053402, partial [Arachis hypogaea]
MNSLKVHQFHANFTTLEEEEEAEALYFLLLHPPLQAQPPLSPQKTQRACKLGISRYPDFEYDPQGGVELVLLQRSPQITLMSFLFHLTLKHYIPPL